MLLDKLSEFCDATALNTGSAGTYNIGSRIDLGVARDIGTLAGKMYLVIEVAVTATSGGSATGQFQLVSDSTSTPAVNGTQTIHAVSAAFAVADMTAGTRLLVIQLPNEIPSTPYEQFLGVQQVTGTAAFTAGAVNAFLVPAVNIHTVYPDAVN